MVSKALRVIAIVVSVVELVFLVLWLTLRPLYLAGAINSGVLLFFVEFIMGLAILFATVVTILLTFVLIYSLVKKAFKKQGYLVLFIFINILLLTCLSISTRYPQYHFLPGFEQWILNDADISAIKAWAADIEVKENLEAVNIKSEDWPPHLSKLMPESVYCTKFENGKYELTLKWHGGLRRIYGLSVLSEGSNFEPNWGGVPREISPGVYVWIF